MLLNNLYFLFIKKLLTAISYVKEVLHFGDVDFKEPCHQVNEFQELEILFNYHGLRLHSQQVEEFEKLICFDDPAVVKNNS